MPFPVSINSQVTIDCAGTTASAQTVKDAAREGLAASLRELGPSSLDVLPEHVRFTVGLLRRGSRANLLTGLDGGAIDIALDGSQLRIGYRITFVRSTVIFGAIAALFLAAGHDLQPAGIAILAILGIAYLMRLPGFRWFVRNSVQDHLVARRILRDQEEDVTV